ncbi:MAG: anthranilate phosphoribosyltransferase [Planctomycetales bacterium]|nr:anthranilate phosphoribosyltransferase [Planctomycetales bacterium]
MIESTLGRVAAGEHLSMDETADVIGAIMDGKWQDEQIGLLLVGLRNNGETVEEVAGAALAMRRHMIPIQTGRDGLIDTCGTGGSGSNTFNISTSAALVTAAAGVPVAKHGNRKITSRSGSADVLAALGVNIEATVVQVERCLDELGICFCFAPLLHPAMKQVAAVRRKLGVGTIFNLLGPLTNPAGAPFQLLGAGRSEFRTLLAEALRLLGTKRAHVVAGADGLGEVTLADATLVSSVTPAGVEETSWTPEDFGIARQELAALTVEDSLQSASIVRDVLAGSLGPARDIVILNSAAALFTAGAVDDLKAGQARATEAIDSGAAQRLLSDLVQLGNQS